MNILIIDNLKRSIQIMRRFLAKAMPDAVVTEYVPAQSGPLAHTFDWAEFDVLLISHELGSQGTGLNLL
tara:strand:+ start:271 stop:477 length:207 start_codon:yes stop_codon:yes gene_type:complete